MPSTYVLLSFIRSHVVLTGDVKIKSDEFILAADNIEVNAATENTIATGNVQFQDNSFIIAGDKLIANRDDDKKLTAQVTNANYQDFGSGLNGANGTSEFLEKKLNNVTMRNATYSLCPINQNDWLIDAKQIDLNLDKNRGIAKHAKIKFFGVPLFYLPKYSWVLSGRGSGFLTPNYSTYTDSAVLPDSFGNTEYYQSVRIPYYINIAPDRDLLIALNYMSSRRFIYEGKYRQLISPKISPDGQDSIWSLEAKLLPEDKITSLKRWLVKFSEELDINDNTHFSAQFYRVSDPEYFKEIDRANTGLKTLKSFLKLTYNENDLALGVLTENVQIVNSGSPIYTKALEGSISKTFNKQSIMPIEVGLTSSKFVHKTHTKTSGTRTHGNFGISRRLGIEYPVITPSASVALTNYSLKNTPNINRTVFGSGLAIDFTVENESNIFGYNVNQRISPVISYNYRGKQIQGNIPIFDTTDKFSELLTFAALTSGERYTGYDRISNANDITLSLESSSRKVNALENDKDILNMSVAQSFYADDEVVSAKTDANYETRKSFSDIAASVDVALGKYVIKNAIQFDPDKSKIVRKSQSLSYSSNSRKFITLKFINTGTAKTEQLYGAIPLTDSIHFFGGIDKTTSTGITNYETTGLAYESCCWAFRIAHFKVDKGLGDGGYNYSTGMELVLTGLGSTSTPLKDRIENRIPGYTAKLR